ncbi:MAG: hypothetical protein AAF869_05755 [Pseudomonadota bacterium]
MISFRGPIETQLRRRARRPIVASVTALLAAAGGLSACATQSNDATLAYVPGAPSSAPSLAPRAQLTSPTRASATDGAAAAGAGPAAPSAMAFRAAHYVDFRMDVDRLDALGLRSLKETREAHERLGAHDPQKLAEGWMAYAALVAADTPQFVEAVRKELRRSSRDRVLKNITEKPRYLSNLAGAGDAYQSVLRTAASDAHKMAAVGEKFRSRSYELQETSWGVKPTADQQQRLKKVRTLAQTRRPSAAPVFPAKRGLQGAQLASAGDDWSAIWASANASKSKTYELSGARAQPVMDQVLILAAQHMLGASDGAYADQTQQLLRNDKTRQCFNWAKLHLDQCIAATRAPYEEAYCLGRHGLDDIAGCVGWVVAGVEAGHGS